jgi:hypothetical protein
MSYKPFCKTLYAQNNGVGIKTALDMLVDSGFKVKDKGETESFSSHDCIVTNGNETFLVEVEKSNIWKKDYDWDTRDEVSVPERKHRSKSKLYVMCNMNMNACVVGMMEAVKKSPVRTRYVMSSGLNEPFFYTPISKFDIYKKVDNKWIAVSENNQHLSKCLNLSPSNQPMTVNTNTLPLS